MSAQDHLQPGQFYHGTTHYFRPGDLVGTEHDSKRYSESDRGNVYFTERNYDDR